MKNTTPKGIHYLISFFGCDGAEVDSLRFWKRVLPQSVAGSSMAVLHSYYYKFRPHGITAFLLLSSSHLSIHTWPEYEHVSCDVFSCATDEETERVIKRLVERVKHGRVKIRKIRRGYVVCRPE